MSDGHLNKCKSCVKVRVRKHRASNLDSVRAYDNARNKQPHRVALAKSTLKRFRRKKHERYLAHCSISNAIRDGKLSKAPCVICNDPNSQAHLKDPSQPMAITWLCINHRFELKRGLILLPLSA